jgi:hypothetical protein
MNTKAFTERIKESSYIQTCTTGIAVYPSLVELLFTYYDHHFSLVEPKDKQLYVKQRLMDIATSLDEQGPLVYDSFNYNKTMSIPIIQHGLQAMNGVSALLYLSDLYKVTTSIYLEGSSTKIRTSMKERTTIHIMYTKNNTWSMLEKPADYQTGDFSLLAECLVMDVKSPDVYTRFLKPIGKYKSSELSEMATHRTISLMNDTKRKLKKELYDDINLYELQNTH